MLGLGDLPVSLRRYLVAIITGGPVVAVAMAVLLPFQVDRTDLQRMALLTAFAVIAEYYTFQLTHKTSINVASACYLAMILVIPVALVGLVAFSAGLAGQFLRRRGDRVEEFFNASQGSIYVSIGALAFEFFRDVPRLGPTIEMFGSLGAIVFLAVVLFLANTAIVAGAAALQLQSSFLRVWLRGTTYDLPAEVAMALLGVTIAAMLVEQPWLLPGLLLPLVLVHRAAADNVRLRRDTYEALGSLMDVVELCDPYTAGHSKRVAATARILALRLGLTHEEADEIEIAGRVHDLGKVGIDKLVLTKTGTLTDAEFAEIQRHAALGAEVVARFSAYGSGHKLIRHHHERWDGCGYPDGLAGEAIPFGSRILAVADAFDAMTSDRAYRDAMGVDQARRVIAAGAGSQWDPEVARAFLEHLDEASAVNASGPTQLAAHLAV